MAVKLNSADFQRGGFTADDAREVVELLNHEHIDLLELSGGSYESPAMQGRTADGRTLAREAYFLEFAAELAKVAHMPLMTTGGVRRLPIAEHVIDSGVAVVGMATALAVEPDLPKRWQAGDAPVGELPAVSWGDKTLAAVATMALVRRQLRRLGAGKASKPEASPLLSLLLDRLRLSRLTKRYQQYLAQR